MYRILVFPSCNEPGLEVVNALAKSNKFELYGGSSVAAEFDPSRMLLKRHIHCPHLGEEGFRQRIDLVFPTADSLVAEFSRWETGRVRFVATNAEAAELFLSKSKTYQRLGGVVPVPRVLDARDVSFPAYAKPDSGGGCRGHMMIGCEEELRLAVRRGLLITEFLPGAEYTVDCINDLKGRLLSANVRLRGHVGRGIALGSRGVHRREILAHVAAIADAVPIEGPWFAQFKEAADGRPKLMEVNVRVAGSMALTRFSGPNIPQLAAFLFLGCSVEVPRSIGGGVINRCLRSIGAVDDFKWVVWDLEDTLLRKDGRPDPDLIGCLYDLHNRGKIQTLISKHAAPLDLMAHSKIPDLFVQVRSALDKLPEMEALVAELGIDLADCIMINDSISEKLAFEKRYPELRILTPDAIDILGREPIA
jgi:ATP-grasp in the biosynthetic pathway with Ter operon